MEVLQVRYSGVWIDYASIKTPEDMRIATATVASQMFDGEAGEYRIVRK